jgi:hypothetical protein
MEGLRLPDAKENEAGMRRYHAQIAAMLPAAIGLSVSAAQASPHQPIQQQRVRRVGAASRPATLGLDQGFTAFETPEFHFRLVKASQTVGTMEPNGANGFDFTPADQLERRASNGFYHLGDLTLRVRHSATDNWIDCSTAADRKPVTPLRASGDVLASADLTPTLPIGCPLKITRTWRLVHGHLTLEFQLTNPGDSPVEIGALGIPMPFNNIISGRTLPQAHEICSFSDPYIGQDAGYLQVTRLSGHGPVLLVTPEAGTPFEAYRLLLEPMRPNQTFEGTFEWMAHSQAYAQNEWKNAQPWNPPTSAVIPPKATRQYGVVFLVAPGVRAIDSTLRANNRPVAVGVPGYILPMDLDARLFLKYDKPVRSISADPPGSLDRRRLQSGHGYEAYAIRGHTWGRARLTITYADGLKQSISYYVTKPSEGAVGDLGRFLFKQQWFTDTSDPFHRAPSVISYDHEAGAQVTQDSRVWIAGLGDEAGSGSWLAAAMKEFLEPASTEVVQYQQFVDSVLWGGIQFKDGSKQYGVRKSMFYYDPRALPNYPYNPQFNWTSWTSWNIPASEDIGRAYNYPHVVAAYWAMYRLARNHRDLVSNHPWQWYLDHAYQTVKYLVGRGSNGDYNVGYIGTGLMEGDIFVALLKDLKREGWTQQAADIEAAMRERAVRWSKDPYPFGSEMAWDSTGQEEVYAWCRYFGYDDKATVALDSILGYMPTLPHWGYNGNARRYWDFLYGGKLPRIERQIHHYGSGINAIPVLAQYRSHPDDFYLLRVGYGGAMGALSNINEDGFASAAFHSFPSTLKWDAYSGDYGPNFFGYAWNAATYIVDHPEFGWLAFGGDVNELSDRVAVRPKDSFRSRVYLAPRGLWLTLDAGKFVGVEVMRKGHTVRVGLARANYMTPVARLLLEQPAKLPGIGAYHPQGHYALEHGTYTIPLNNGITWIELTDGR